MRRTSLQRTWSLVSSVAGARRGNMQSPPGLVSFSCSPPRGQGHLIAGGSSGLEWSSRHCYATNTGGGDEPLEIEVLDATTEVRGSSTSTTSQTEDSPFDDLVATHITKLDSFVTSRVAMCLKRVNGAAAGAVKYQLSKEPKRDAATGKTIHRAEAKFLVNGKPHKATGYSIGDPKEAELACATHIERLLDNFGIVMFQLSRKQEAHVEAAKADGRFAPMPNAKPKSASEMSSTLVSPLKYRPGKGVKKKPPALSSGNVVFRKDGDKTGSKGGDVSSMSLSSQLLQFRHQGHRTREADRMLRRAVADGVAPDQGDGEGATDDIELNAAGEVVVSSEGGGTWRPNSHFTCKILPRKPKLRPHERHKDETEGGDFTLVERSNILEGQGIDSVYHHTPYTLLSPNLFCPRAVGRVRDWWDRSNLPGSFDGELELTEHKVRAFGSELFEGKMELPFAKGTFVRAKASTQETVINLAAMHFELLLDSLGLPLFDNESYQKQHADDVKCVGRWAIDHVPKKGSALTASTSALATMDGNEMKARRSVPKGLKEWVIPKGRQHAMSERVAPLSPDEDLISFHRSVVFTFGLETAYLLPEDCQDVLQHEGVVFGTPMQIIRDFLVARGEQRESFYFCNNQGTTFRCTLALPLPLATYGVRGGCAIGPSVEVAKAMCAYHAIDVLCTVGVAVFPDPEKQAAFVKYRKVKELVCGDEGTSGPKAFSPPRIAARWEGQSVTPPPSRDWAHIVNRHWEEWTCLPPLANSWKLTVDLSAACYTALFGYHWKRGSTRDNRGELNFKYCNRHSVPGEVRCHHYTPLFVRWNRTQHCFVKHHTYWLRRPPAREGEKQDELPLAIGRCVDQEYALQECASHFLTNCLRIRALHQKFTANEFVDQEILPLWFGRDEKLKENAWKMTQVIHIAAIRPGWFNPERQEEKVRGTNGAPKGAPLFHSVGFTSRKLWEKTLHTLQSQEKNRKETAEAKAERDEYQKRWER